MKQRLEKMIKICLLTKKTKNLILLKGGTDVFSAVYEVFGSLINLGENMATEFESIKNLPAQINNASAPVAGQPNTP